MEEGAVTDDRYLCARTVLQDRHREHFTGLTHHEVGRVVSRLQRDSLLPRVSWPEVATGEWLFDTCRSAGLDHAAVVFPLCAETDSLGLSALVRLIGKPLLVWRRPPPTVRPTVVARDGTPIPPRSAGTFSPDLVVLRKVPNPKKPGSSTWLRYKLWVPGQTVAQCMAAGLTRADVLWDIDESRRFVVLGTAEQWEDLAADQAELDLVAGSAAASGEVA